MSYSPEHRDVQHTHLRSITFLDWSKRVRVLGFSKGLLEHQTDSNTEVMSIEGQRFVHDLCGGKLFEMSGTSGYAQHVVGSTLVA